LADQLQIYLHPGWLGPLYSTLIEYKEVESPHVGLSNAQRKAEVYEWPSAKGLLPVLALDAA